MRAILLFFYLLSVVVTPASAATRPPSLNAVLDEVFHKEVLLTVAGIKPVSSIEMSVDDYKVLTEARSLGKIGTKNVNFRLANSNAYHDSKRLVFVEFYNPLAIQRLLSDPKRMALLSHEGFRSEMTAREALAHLHGILDPIVTQRRHGAPWRRVNVLAGIFYGFPIADVKAFSKLKDPRRSSNDLTTFGGFYTPVLQHTHSSGTFYGGSFRTLTDDGRRELELLQKLSMHALFRYRLAMESRTSNPRKLYNHWDKETGDDSLCTNLLILSHEDR